MTAVATETMTEIRRIAAELDALPYVKQTWTCLAHEHGWKGNAGGGHYDVVAACGGATVYHDVIDQGGHGTRAYVLAVADKVILGAQLRGRGERETATALEQVARLRLLKSYRVSSPELPPDAGLYYKPRAVSDEPLSAINGAAPIGAQVVKYLQLHTRKPFGPRGISWMAERARDAWRAALQESGWSA